MSVEISIENAIKIYGTNKVIDGLSLDVKKGELFTLLGPSGCGKTTLLRMIAGFNSIEGGDFYFGEDYVNDLDPAKRNIGMVFQNYAIFPHMSVFDNVSFGLKNFVKDKEEIKERTLDILELMQISELKDRMPEKLSGGQQQRVALARAIVLQPQVLLMDEPLSNLDAKLRVDMRGAIKNIQNTIGITTIYVTHDQEEAMSISDRIAVMNKGVIQQVGTPKEIYLRPSNEFVATFIGKTNIIPARVVNNKIFLGESNQVIDIDLNQEFKNEKIKVSIRPEDMKISLKNEGTISGVIREISFLGMVTHYTIVVESIGEIDVIEDSKMYVSHSIGEQVDVEILSHKINVFNESGMENITKFEEVIENEKTKS